MVFYFYSLYYFVVLLISNWFVASNDWSIQTSLINKPKPTEPQNFEGIPQLDNQKIGNYKNVFKLSWLNLLNYFAKN